MNARIGWQNLRTSEFLDSGDYLLITGVDFKSGGVDLEHCKFVDERRYEQDKKIQLSEGSILLTKDGTLGKVAFIKSLPKPATLNAGVFNIRVINPEKLSPKFLYIYLSGPFLMDYVAKTSTGGTIQHLNQSVLRDFLVPYPKFEEQEKISSILDGVNQIITLHQRKEEELQKLKKGLLQKMFPKDGESVPEIRFPNFTDSWEQRKLNEVISRFIVPMRDKPKSFDGNIPWTRIEDIEGNEISRSLTNQNVSEETVEKMNLRIIPKDSLIVSASATFGVTAFVKANLITNQTFIGLVPNDNIDLGFLYYSFNAPSLRTQMKMESAGSTIFYIPQDRFKEMVISLPNIKEQYKLAKLFSDLDKLITLHHRKTEELKKLKKALLQQMFV